MIQGKKGPFILITSLIVIACFVGGMQYGKYIQQTDEKIQSTLSITPSQAPSPTLMEAVYYETYRHEECGIELLSPSTLTVSKEASTGAHLSEKNTSQFITVDCAAKPLPTPQTASQEAELGNRVGIAYDNGKTVHFRVRNAQGQLITAEVSKELAPLFITSFTFLD